MEELTLDMENKEPCGALFDLLARVGIPGLSGQEKVTAYILAGKIAAFGHAIQLEVLHHVDDLTELAMAGHEPERALGQRKEFSRVVETLPRLFAQLRRGEIDQRRLEVVDERVAHLPTQALITQVEDTLIEVAPGLNRSQLARQTTKLVALADPDGSDRRCQQAKAERRVEFRPLPDGMAQLKAVLPAVEARMAYDLLNADVAELPQDDRTTDQKRADAFLDRFLANTKERQVQVHVTIPVETLIGLTKDPGLLDGYGPIPAELACELAMQGPWRGILLDEYRHATGMSTAKYRPTAPMREMVKIHDGGTCTAPGCTSPIRELDHVIPWPKGKTTATQLKGLCSWHHHRKHDNYTVTLDPDGTTTWTTPQGRVHTTRPHQY
ncbi:HNH endonuclease [Kutzneria kofuensis]|uniref:DUF222 domain-containing protein n=2 Tax=Kutzneria kofuensis TaxID=103725 RepID=A0A7W9KBX0_9PSEU|nr:HNH endonuclease signature motif containing protein [Kutzneria kofuensis]MBB5889353.1 hypothetical protein [Kutzneria kofuensis]